VALLQPIADAFFELVDGLGGTVSGEHGDGRLRSAYVRRKYPSIYDLFLITKQLLDPQSIFNPEIKVHDDPEQMTRNLRFGAEYKAGPISGLRLNWQGVFVEEVEKCHGCSKCITVTTATRMCPVYKFTRDEAAAPKAKANVLRALISGAIENSELYRESLQSVMAQCVNCGSCYMECPSHVNIPKMAMEAKAQYVRRFGCALPERLTSHVELAAKLTHKWSALIGPLVRRPAVRRIAARLTGLAQERPMVVFDRRPLLKRLPRLTPGKGPQVLYYAGCYAAYIRPELGQAAVGVLGRMGCAVHLPPQSCCGLPQLSKGLVAAARRTVRRNLSDWQDLLERADYITVTCSSCGYALMQDWSYLVGEKEAARISAKTVHISHLINQCGGWQNDARLDTGQPGLAAGLSPSLSPAPSAACRRQHHHAQGHGRHPDQRPEEPLLRHGRQLGHAGQKHRPEQNHRSPHGPIAQCIRRRLRDHRLPHLPDADGAHGPASCPPSR
jgi:Fe-S oxidoreductase